LIDGLTCVARDKGEVDNYFKEAIDLEKNGRVDWHDVPLILQASAMGWGSGVGGAEPPFAVQTPVDRLFDADNSGLVSADEIESSVRALSGDIDAVDQLKRELQAAFDWNDDGRIEAWETEEVKAWLIFPRPVNPDEGLDRDADENGDGFLDPAELGISAGMTSKGSAPPSMPASRHSCGGRTPPPRRPRSAAPNRLRPGGF
jgi:hypothetical protein